MNHYTPISIPGFTDPVSSFTHLFIIPVFIYFAYLLLKKRRGHDGTLIYHMIYLFAVLFMFSMSGTYHLLDRASAGREVLQRLDYSGIFLLIAATFTPIHGILFRKFYRWGILLLLWLLGINGIVFISIFFTAIPEWLSLTFFLSMGWIGLFSGYLVVTEYGYKFIKPLLYGALSYTIGAIIDYLRWPVIIEGVAGPHEIFHIFVIMGVFFHFRFIYSFASKNYLTEWEKLLEPEIPAYSRVHINFKKAESIDYFESLHLQKSSFRTIQLDKQQSQNIFNSHKHKEAVYLVLWGDGAIDLDNESIAIKEGDIVRVSPWVRRKIKAGKKGMLIAAFGSMASRRTYSTEWEADTVPSSKQF